MPIGIVIGVAPVLQRIVSDYAGPIASGLNNYLRNLTRELSLPVDVTTSLEITTEDSVAPYRIMIGTRKCRLQRFNGPAADAPAEEWIACMAREICDNRDLFLTPAVIAASRAEMPAAPSLADNDLYQLLDACFRHGLGFHRAFDFIRGASGQSIADLAAFETDCLSSKTKRITFLLGAGTKLKRDELEPKLAAIPAQVFAELGVMLPKIRIEDSAELAHDEFRLQLNDLLMPLARTNSIDPLMSNVLRTATKHAGLFLNTDMVRYYLMQLASSWPALVEAITKRFDVLTLTQILRELLDEELSIKNLPAILETLLAVNGELTAEQADSLILLPNTAVFLTGAPPISSGQQPTPAQIVAYSECVRTAFRRSISYKYSKGTYVLSIVYVPDADVREAIVPETDISRSKRDALLATIFDAVSSRPKQSACAIYTTADKRRPLRKLIEKEFPNLPVISSQEISPELHLKAMRQPRRGSECWPAFPNPLPSR